MCLQCKSLMGCSKNGCMQTATPKESVAELLARSLSVPDDAFGSKIGRALEPARRNVELLAVNHPHR